jgi:hypothetical protein
MFALLMASFRLGLLANRSPKRTAIKRCLSVCLSIEITLFAQTVFAMKERGGQQENLRAKVHIDL